jgi:pyruvate/2-oxoglutarate/acetoin dehydrogenase E1 component
MNVYRKLGDRERVLNVCNWRQPVTAVGTAGGGSRPIADIECSNFSLAAAHQWLVFFLEK